MQIPRNYEINVATQPQKNAAYGRHYCRIELGDCMPEVAMEKFQFIKGIFPADWNITLREIICYGKEIS